MKSISITRILTTLLFASAAHADADPRAATFRELCAALAGRAEETIAVPGRDGWFFLRDELRHIGVGPFWGAAARQVSRATRDDRKDPLPAIVAYHEAMQQAGIELWVLPVPPKALLVPERLADGFEPDDTGLPPRLDAVHRDFYATLRDAGVTVLDIWPVLAEMRRAGDIPAFCRTDTHWSPAACVAVARHLAAAIRQRPWFAAIDQSPFAVRKDFITVAGDLVTDWAGDSPRPEEKLPVRYVGIPGADGALIPIEPDAASPILVLADSHGLVFHAGGDMLASGAGLVDQLAYETGIVPDLLGVRGSGATPSRINLFRRAQRTPGYLAAKRLVIWVFTAREFTESAGWAEIPLSR